jgi:hypothetical protein
MISGMAKAWAQVYRKHEIGPWQKWFAWYPVTIHGNSTWLKTIYRRKINTYVDMNEWSYYEYGTVFDIIKE